MSSQNCVLSVGTMSAPRVSFRQAWCRVPFVLAAVREHIGSGLCGARDSIHRPKAITSGSCFTHAPRVRRRDPDLDRILRPLSPTLLLARTVQVPPVGVVPASPARVCRGVAPWSDSHGELRHRRSSRVVIAATVVQGPMPLRVRFAAAASPVQVSTESVGSLPCRRRLRR